MRREPWLLLGLTITACEYRAPEAEPPENVSREGPAMTLRPLLQSVRFFESSVGTEEPGAPVRYDSVFDAARTRFVGFHAAFDAPTSGRVVVGTPECAFGRRGSELLYRATTVVRQDTASPVAALYLYGATGGPVPGGFTPGVWYFACGDGTERILRDSVRVEGDVVIGRLFATGELPFAASVSGFRVQGSETAAGARHGSATRLPVSRTRFVRLDVQLRTTSGAAFDVPVRCAYFTEHGSELGEFRTVVSAVAPDTVAVFGGSLAGPGVRGGWTPGRYFIECTTQHRLVARIGFEVVRENRS